mmetsp:Transcript_37016/g.86057  ORF Transcript_37016/g.86057 Transcript_37016/m.86057 type:complete len:262 (+) Transcript_37016:491-1276(+)
MVDVAATLRRGGGFHVIAEGGVVRVDVRRAPVGVARKLIPLTHEEELGLGGEGLEHGGEEGGPVAVAVGVTEPAPASKPSRCDGEGFGCAVRTDGRDGTVGPIHPRPESLLPEVRCILQLRSHVPERELGDGDGRLLIRPARENNDERLVLEVYEEVLSQALHHRRVQPCRLIRQRLRRRRGAVLKTHHGEGAGGVMSLVTESGVFVQRGHRRVNELLDTGATRTPWDATPKIVGPIHENTVESGLNKPKGVLPHDTGVKA